MIISTPKKYTNERIKTAHKKIIPDHIKVATDDMNSVQDVEIKEEEINNEYSDRRDNQDI